MELTSLRREQGRIVLASFESWHELAIAINLVIHIMM